MNELEQMNENIYEMEKNILDRKLEWARQQYALDITILEYKNNLDPKLKEYSNEDKREAEAMKVSIIKTQAEELKTHKQTTDKMEITLRYLLRKFDIMIKSELI